MKKIVIILTVITICLSLLVLCSCSYEAKIIGTWEGDGTLSSLEEPIITAVRQLTFEKDGTGYVHADEGRIPFTYAMTDDTLTLRFDEVSWGVQYKISGYTLTLRRDAVFTRVN